MSYSKERDEFIARATAEGLTLPVVRKLLRYASTLQRLAVAQCNGDWPYNGDRDRPSMTFKTCGECNGTGQRSVSWLECANHDSGDNPDDPIPMDLECFTCQSTGKLQTNGRELERFDARYVVCPKCETSGVVRSALRASDERVSRDDSRGEKYHSKNTSKLCVMNVCPDCRTQELVTALLQENRVRASGDKCTCLDGDCRCPVCASDAITPVFGGDPRGAVLRLSTPNYPYDESGKNGARGLYVPARNC